jgi:hypothetical protein
MKNTRKELETDFIGGQEPLTAQEEKSLSEYFKKKKNAKGSPTEKKNVQPQNVN